VSAGDDAARRTPPPVRPPEIAELRAFCLAADLGSLGRAAIALKVSQPAVSKRLRTLEALAGTKLLARSPRGVSLTPAGRSLYPEAQRLLGQAAAIESTLGSLSSASVPIRLAVSHTIAEYYLPAALVAFDARNPASHIPIELTAANSSAVRRMLRDERADVGIAAVEEDLADEPLEARELVRDEIVVVVPQDHLWFQRQTVPRAAFLRTPMILRDPDAHSRRLVDRTLAASGERLAEPLSEVGSTVVAKREAIDRRAPALISALAIDEERDRLYARPVEGLIFARSFAVMFRSTHTLSPEQRSVVDFLVSRGAPGER
jgi:DNA-binding transcriptional LysR family regulator